MMPTLKAGDEVLVDVHAYRHKAPQVGDVVVAEHPHRPNFYLIKRISQLRQNGACFLVGDNQAESTDSRQLGWFATDKLVGRVTSYL